MGLTLKIPIKEDIYNYYKFKGWYYNNEKFTNEDGTMLNSWDIDENITIIAMYDEIERGTQENPYEISNIDELARYLIEAKSESYFVLVDNIDFSEYGSSLYKPILEFKGTFDGNGYSIIGYQKVINTSGTDNVYLGLFRKNSGTIRNLKLSSCKFHVTGTDPLYTYVGAICGVNLGGTIENCIVENCSINSITGTKNNKETYSADAGGVAGANTGTITKCGATGNTIYACTSTSGWSDKKCYAYSGGIAGSNCNIIDNCYSRSNTKIHALAYSDRSEWGENKAYPNSGGLVGFSWDNSQISNCIAYHNKITTEGSSANNDRIGSLVGFISQLTMSQCFSKSTDTLFGAGQTNSGGQKLASNETMDLETLALKSFDISYWKMENGNPVIDYDWKSLN